MTDESVKGVFQNIENQFNEAVVSNDVERIRNCISDDWVLVDARGGIISRQRFLDVVGQGVLTHQTMTKEVLRVKVYDDLAVVTGRGRNTGMYNGQPIEADEWVTDIYRKDGTRWICVLTHLTPVSKPSG